jgi:hypothetical protein
VEKTSSSIAEALKQAHRTLLADLRTLENAARRSAKTDPAELSTRLAATRTHLADHFKFEEQDGYMDAVRKREPRLERVIQQIAEEHGDITQSLDALIGEVRGAGELGDAVREKVRTWIKRVRRHEARENELVQGAFNLDISAED